MPFKKGQSGNLKGRPKGVPDRRGELKRKLEARANEVLDAAIDRAIGGDSLALKLVMERLIPTLKPETTP
jgi:hypothetical protein